MPCILSLQQRRENTVKRCLQAKSILGFSTCVHFCLSSTHLWQTLSRHSTAVKKFCVCKPERKNYKPDAYITWQMCFSITLVYLRLLNMKWTEGYRDREEEQKIKWKNGVTPDTFCIPYQRLINWLNCPTTTIITIKCLEVNISFWNYIATGKTVTQNNMVATHKTVSLKREIDAEAEGVNRLNQFEHAC